MVAFRLHLMSGASVMTVFPLLLKLASVGAVVMVSLQLFLCRSLLLPVAGPLLLSNLLLLVCSALSLRVQFLARGLFLLESLKHLVPGLVVGNIFRPMQESTKILLIVIPVEGRFMPVRDFLRPMHVVTMLCFGRVHLLVIA